MTLVYIDGLEDTSGVIATNGTIAIVAARTGNGIRVTGSSGSFRLGFPTPYFDTVTVGCAWRPSTLTGTIPIFTLYGDGGVTTHTSVTAANGNLVVQRSTTTIATAASPPFVVANRWYYVEAQIRLHDTLGTAVVRVDGVEVLNASALDTKNAGTGTWYDQIGFPFAVSGNAMFDDVYLMAGAGDSFQGDCVVATLVPTGNGVVNQWVGSDGDSVDNYALVDEIPPSTADYVRSPTIGQQDLYTLSDLATTGAILAVAPTLYVAKDEVGPRTVKPLLRGAAISAGAALTLDFAYAQKQAIFTANPETAAAWTLGEVNALQVGVEVA
jgi:hypothetical protein